jgi:saccharopine dehydrogenase (NAD+, L-lysine-forming)
MEKIKIGLLREGKVPPDKRVPLTPAQCKHLTEQYNHLEIVVQKSPIRAYTDEQYSELGIPLVDEVNDCDILMGVKEVNVTDLIPNKKFLFFSHTFKKQTYNRNLLRKILDNRIQLIDYEVLTNQEKKRIVGFGRFAGIVGAYNGIYAYGKKTGLFDIKRVKDCFDRAEMEAELQKVVLAKDFKMVLTGFGRVGYGAREIIEMLPITEVAPDEFLNDEMDGPMFTHLETYDYYRHAKTGKYEKKEFYSKPGEFVSVLAQYVKKTNVYVACHYWSKHSPKLLMVDDLKEAKDLKVVADISCDIAGPIPCTIRPSTIADPIYGYNARNQSETNWANDEAICVMAVDNLPCELPKEASEDFGIQLVKNVMPHLLGEDVQGVIERGSETTVGGTLSDHFSFLQDYVDDKDE